MWRSMIKVVAATAGFAVVHSALASRAAKKTAARWLGQRHRNGLYRVFYLAQSGLTLWALAAYIRRLPDRDLYRVRGPLVYVMHGGQALAVVYAVLAAHQVGIPAMLGTTSLAAWFRGEEGPPEPEAQGPGLHTNGTMRTTGPFALSRHPLNLVPVVIFWLSPRMTVRLAAFNIVSTLYLVVGSIHEETRLRAAYGMAYEEYQKSGVPFYLPWPHK